MVQYHAVMADGLWLDALRVCVFVFFVVVACRTAWCRSDSRRVPHAVGPYCARGARCAVRAGTHLEEDGRWEWEWEWEAGAGAGAGLGAGSGEVVAAQEQPS
jgi:hypothetical protein